MALSLKVLNSDAILNSFIDIGSLQIYKGADAKLIVQLFQPDKKIRYIPASGAVITIDFLKNDNTVLTKTATYPFADDRSILQFVLSDTETLTVVSQNLLAKIDEAGNISYAGLQMGLQLVPTSQGC